MEYTIKNKIEVTKDFLEEQINKNWQEAKALQQLAANINVDTRLGAKVAELLKNISTNYYIIIGNLEALSDGLELDNADEKGIEQIQNEDAQECQNYEVVEPEPNLVITERQADFEPFEYFVDFDEPIGEPISDLDLYGN